MLLFIQASLVSTVYSLNDLISTAIFLPKIQLNLDRSIFQNLCILFPNQMLELLLYIGILVHFPRHLFLLWVYTISAFHLYLSLVFPPPAIEHQSLEKLHTALRIVLRMVHLAEFGLRLELHGYKYRFSAKKIRRLWAAWLFQSMNSILYRFSFDPI